MAFQILDEEDYSRKSVSNLSNQQLEGILNTEIKYPRKVFELVNHEVKRRNLSKEEITSEEEMTINYHGFPEHLKLFIDDYPLNIFILIAICLLANVKALPVIFYFIYYSWKRYC